MKLAFSVFREVWSVDFEYRPLDGCNPEVRCMAALEYHSGRRIVIWADELYKLNHPPFNIGSSSLYVAYYASAEFSCHLALAWELPVYVLDLCFEFKNLNSNILVSGGKGLLGCALHYGIKTMEATEKKEMRELAMVDKRHWEYTLTEKKELMEYCFEDVALLSKILPKALV